MSSITKQDMFNDNGSSTASPSSEMLRVKFAPAMAAAVGLTQVIMGVLKLGSMTRYLSSPMVSGFTVGVAVHVLTSQVRTLLGVTSPKPNGLFAIPRMYYELFRNITTTNVVTVGLSAVCITVLAIVKTWINPKVTKRIRIPIPIDLITLILATVTSDRLELNHKYNVSVVGEISRGIPPPLVPAINELSDSITDILVIAIVAYSVSISMARILAKELDYKVDANQCCLSAVIVVALKGMFAHALELKDLWKYSLWDFSIWTLTCVCTVILDVKFGLLFGVAFSALTIVLRTQSPSARLIRKAVGTEFYCEFDADSDQTVSAPVRVVRYEGSLYYACADQFRQVIFEKSCVDPVHVFSKLQHIRRKLNALHRRMDLDVFTVENTIGPGSQAFGNQELHSTFVENDETTPTAFTTRPAVTTSMKFDSVGTSQNKLSDGTGRNREAELLSQLAALENACALQYLVLDCTSWNFIDFVGADELKQITEDYKKVGVRISLAGLKDQLRELLLSNGKLPEEVETFPSVYDAVKAATANLTSNSEHLREIHSMIAAQKDSNTTFVDSNLPDNSTNNVDLVDSPIK
ncbi:unnamed protein product [Dicrocoelium dendriticum]|nr:unnamed protein product [Dicrocoelium dendriticum]